MSSCVEELLLSLLELAWFVNGWKKDGLCIYYFTEQCMNFFQVMMIAYTFQTQNHSSSVVQLLPSCFGLSHCPPCHWAPLDWVVSPGGGGQCRNIVPFLLNLVYQFACPVCEKVIIVEV